jgi:hypothetical protein
LGNSLFDLNWWFIFTLILFRLVFLFHFCTFMI